MEPRDQYEKPLDWALARARELFGMNKSQFARAIGVSAQDVNNWIARQNLPPEHYQRIAVALHCSIDELVGLPAARGPPADWPFPEVPPARLQLLSSAERMHVQAAMLEELARLEDAKRGKYRQPERRTGGYAKPHTDGKTTP